MLAERETSRPAAGPVLTVRDVGLASLVFLCATVIATYPQVRQLSTHTGTHYDALFGVWRMAWIAHQLAADPQHLFDANIFYPEPDTLAYSDAALFPALLGAPLLWAGVPPLVAYNLLVLLSFVAAGVGMFVLVHALTGSRAAALFGGMVFAFQPYRFAHFPHLELLWTCWIPLSLWALHRVLREPTWSGGFGLGLFAAFQVLTSIYYGVFLATALAILGPVLALAERRRHRWRLWMPALGMALPLILLVVPYAQPYRRSAAAVGERDEVAVGHWSPRLVNYLEPQDGNWFYPRHGDIDPFEGVLLPGVGVVILAIIGAQRGWRHDRMLVAGYALLLVVAVDMSLGSNGLSFGFVREWAWPYRGLRVPARMFVLVSAALAVLASLAVASFARLARARAWQAVAIGAVFVETLSIPIALKAAPLPPVQTLRFLANQPLGPVLHWPLPPPDQIGFTWDPTYMYFSAFHWRPLLNGYSGNYPESYLRFLIRTRGFPGPEAVAALQRAGVRYVVVHSVPDERAFVEAVDTLRQNGALAYQFREKTADEEVALFVLSRQP